MSILSHRLYFISSSVISVYKLFQRNFSIPEAYCALLVLKMYRIFRTAMKTSKASFTMMQVFDMICYPDIIRWADLRTGSAFDAGIINNKAFISVTCDLGSSCCVIEPVYDFSKFIESQGILRYHLLPLHYWYLRQL